ncbi:MAG: hypothetical protein OXU74_06620 [Gemmatimonadota bacterium]|nr:hypothetical protein [Gemmatimonadota bacterium]
MQNPTPNVEALRMLADHMDGLPSLGAAEYEDAPAVYMCAWIDNDHMRDDCGTVGCIAGHAVALVDGHEAAVRLARDGGCSDIPTRARAILGLVDPEAEAGGDATHRLARVAHALMYPPGQRSEEPRIREVIDAINGADCARLLRRVVDNADTVTAVDVRLMWEDVKDIRRAELYGGGR